MQKLRYGGHIDIGVSHYNGTFQKSENYNGETFTRHVDIRTMTNLTTQLNANLGQIFDITQYDFKIKNILSGLYFKQKSFSDANVRTAGTEPDLIFRFSFYMNNDNIKLLAQNNTVTQNRLAIKNQGLELAMFTNNVMSSTNASFGFHLFENNTFWMFDLGHINQNIKDVITKCEASGGGADGKFAGTSVWKIEFMGL